MERPMMVETEDHAPLAVWSGAEDIIKVMHDGRAYELHVGVREDQVDALLDGVARDRGTLGSLDELSDLIVVRGARVLGVIRRRAGQAPEVMRCCPGAA